MQGKNVMIHIRKATLDDVASLAALIELCTHTLSLNDYDASQIAAALGWVFGVDETLITDGTYYVVESNADEVIACGGWSFRKRPFGGAANTAMNSDLLLDPVKDAAIIRAFFVHPEHVRKGLGRQILDASEQQALAMGFQRAETTATLTGEPLYRANGYVETERVLLEKEGYVPFPAVKMAKKLSC